MFAQVHFPILQVCYLFFQILNPMSGRIFVCLSIALAAAPKHVPAAIPHTSGPQGFPEDSSELVHSLIEEESGVVVLGGSSGGVQHFWPAAALFLTLACAPRACRPRRLLPPPPASSFLPSPTLSRP